MKKSALFIILLLAMGSMLWAQNRFALVIGNANYPRAEDVLPNTINDTNDISAALRALGYDVVLRHNLGRLEMIREVNAFIARLGSNRNSEGFFWYAGHAIEIGGENYLMPLDVVIEDDYEIIKETSYSVTSLTRQLDGVRNKVNVVVLDACRVPPSTGGGRSLGDASRVIKTVSNLPPDLLIIYSTASGRVASDGTGRRNSPFAEAFLKHINSTEALTLVVGHIANETLSLTQQQQRPYFSGSIYSDVYYSLNPTGVQPDPVPDGLEWRIVDGRSVTITGYTGNAARLDIPERIQGLLVTAIGENAFSEPWEDSAGGWDNRYTSLTSITLPSSVTAIGGEAFSWCINMTSITVDSRNPAYASVDGVLFDKAIRTIIQYPAGKPAVAYSIPSSVRSIGEWAFFYCNSLTSVTIPSSVTSIGERAFYHCYSLTNISIPSSVTSIGDYAFRSCISLTIITIPSSVAAIGGGAFQSCSSLTSVTILSSVTAIREGAFSGCHSLASVSIPSSVTSIGNYAFQSCSSLTSVSIPSSVRSIGDNAFSYCSSLTSINIPFSVTSIGDGTFSGCSGLTSITVDRLNPAYTNVDGVLFDKNIRTIIQYPAGKQAGTYTIPSSVTYIGGQAFSGCSSLTSVNIPSSVTSIGDGAFSGCSSLTSVSIPSSVAAIGGGTFQSCSSLASVSIPSSVRSIGDGAFSYCSSLTSVSIPSSVTSIGSSAFSGCSSLASITIPSSVTAIGDNAFYRCSSLTSITVDRLNPAYASVDGVLFDKAIRTLIQYPQGKQGAYTIPTSVTSIGYLAFQSCSSLTSVSIPSSVTSIDSNAFYGCSSLTSISIPSSVTSIGWYAFYGCSSLTSVSIPSSVTSIGEGAFYDCSSLASVSIPSSVTSIGEGAFYGCSSLASVSIPSSVTAIGDNAFYRCSSLTSVSIPSSVTSIGWYAFSGCSSLISISIPFSVASIGIYAFYSCRSLTSVTLSRGTQVAEGAFPDTARIVYRD